MQNPTHEELVEQIRAEIMHHISPVIGWLRSDAMNGRQDLDRKRLDSYHDRIDRASESIATLFKNNQ